MKDFIMFTDAITETPIILNVDQILKIEVTSMSGSKSVKAVCKIHTLDPNHVEYALENIYYFKKALSIS